MGINNKPSDSPTTLTLCERQTHLYEVSDEKAVSEFCNDLWTKLVHFFMSRVGNKDDAEDLTALVVDKFFKAVARYGEKLVPEKWLGLIWIIAYREKSNFFRKRRRVYALVQKYAIEIEVDRQTTPALEDVVILRQRQMQLDAAILQLSPLDQKIIALRCFGISHAEIAMLLDHPDRPMSEESVRKRYNRALATLKGFVSERR